MAIPEYLREIANARIEASQRGELVGWIFDVEENNGGLVPFDSTYHAVFDKRIEVVCFGCDGNTYGGLSLLKLSRQSDYSHAVLAEEKAIEHGKAHARRGEQCFIVRIFRNSSHV